MSTALYVDFDNVFSGLLELHLTAALRFAEEPETWLEKLTSTYTVDGPRRWSVLRCYINSSGSAKHPTAERPRIPFASFRSAFVRSGFEVIDCPALTPQMKNAADIKMAIDIVDAIHGSTRYDEFVIASADSDFTPLLVRLRAAGLSTTLLSSFEPVGALTSVVDRVVDRRQMLELMGSTESPAPSQPSPKKSGRTVVAMRPSAVPEPPLPAELDRAKHMFEREMRRRYTAAKQPLQLSSLGQVIAKNVGPLAKSSKWFGHGSFCRAVDSLDLPHLERSQHHLWNGKDHVPPRSAKATSVN